MKNYTAHTIKLQDGTLFNFQRRVKRHVGSLLSTLTQVIDGRSNQGKRHPLEDIVFMLFCSILAGCTTIADCHRWAIHNRRFLTQFVELTYGIPDPTTISYALQLCDVGSLITVWNTWRRTVYGFETDRIASMDGKTMRGVHGTDIIRHILSLFTHGSHQTIGQVGVFTKENEIPAALRLFKQTSIVGLTVIADALHTQKDTITALLVRHAQYLLMVKENQRELYDAVKTAFTDERVYKQRAVDNQYTRGRSIETVVDVITDTALTGYFGLLGWKQVFCIGRLYRSGTRTVHGETNTIDETVYFISSRNDLTAKEAIRIVRNHWKIENNLHWQKDHTYLEDQQTVRLGNAPQVMSFLRSMSIGLIKLFDISSITEAVTNFRMNRSLHHQFLAYAQVV